MHSSDRFLDMVEVNTVDGFQGREMDIVIFSCVRTSMHSLGFLSDERRMNVAITRAKKCLVIVGNETALSRDKHWAALISSIKARGFFQKTV
jgi:senataxin